MPLTSISELDLNLSSFRFNKKLAKAFQDNINQQVLALNDAIELYNDPKHASKKMEILKPIALRAKALKDLEFDTLRLQVIVNRYEAFVDDNLRPLLSEIEAERYTEEVRVREQRRADRFASPKTLTELIEDMSSDDVGIFTRTLMRSENKETLKNNLGAFYPSDHPKAVDFDVFLKTHDVGIIPSTNSKIFTVNALGTNEKQVLKVEYVHNTQEPELHLRKRAELSGVFTPIFVRKPVTYYHPEHGRMVQGNLVVTEFCEGNNVEAHGKDFGNDDEARLRGAADIHTQMADILIKIEAAGCAFPDMKDTNWLVDSSGKLRVADGKSFMFSPYARALAS